MTYVFDPIIEEISVKYQEEIWDKFFADNYWDKLLNRCSIC